MRLKTPRYAPLPQDAVLTEEQQALIDGLNPQARPLNLFRTMLHAPKAMRGTNARHSEMQGEQRELEPRDGEIL
jgi:hypothetical protein